MSNRHTKYRFFLYKIANRLRYVEGLDFAAEVDAIIEEIRRKKLDKWGPYEQLIKWLEGKKAEVLEKPKAKARQYDPFEIPMSGVGRVALFGLSNVGKSTLMNAITNTEVEVGAFLHTTTIGQAGACNYQGVTFQIVDLPGFLDFREDWTISKQINRVARTSDAVVMVVDLTMDLDRQLEFLTEQLVEAKILVDGESEYKIAVIATKGDLPGSKETYQELLKKTTWAVYPTAYNNEKSLEQLKKSLFDLLKIIRVYTKTPGEKPNLDVPFVIRKGATVADVAEKIHTSFLKRFRYAKIWGTSTVHDGHQVGLSHILHDKDIIELTLSR
ncbi:MAG: TGS domain-containing protein [Candidatus Heimdallarchaeota archaeon]|nr:TGS domain-containing protein [Candidatus Heimdallarchaeota archaeon]